MFLNSKSENLLKNHLPLFPNCDLFDPSKIPKNFTDPSIKKKKKSKTGSFQPFSLQSFESSTPIVDKKNDSFLSLANVSSFQVIGSDRKIGLTTKEEIPKKETSSFLSETSKSDLVFQTQDRQENTSKYGTQINVLSHEKMMEVVQDYVIPVINDDKTDRLEAR